MFDLDGLLLDSEDAWGRAEERVVRELGQPWDPAVRTLLLGKGPTDAARALAGFLGLADVAGVERRMLAAATAEFDAGLDARPGAQALLDALDGNVPCGVATNSRRVLADMALEALGWMTRFPVVVCAEDVARPKPAPEPYLTACARLGADPSRAVCLEDSPIGVASARAAGMWVIGCPSFPGERLDAAHAVVASLVDLSAPPAHR